ncbi:MAG: hypothetical protein WBS54_07705 [Acidobacteriota bacterium]
MRVRAILALALVLAVALPALPYDVVTSGHIFSEAEALGMYRSEALPARISPPFWTPTVVEVSEAEKAILEYLKANQRYKNSRMTQMYDAYKHQYIGFTSQGHRCIYVNAFTTDGYPRLGDSWQERLVSVLDGGELFFQVSVDYDQLRVLKVWVNGVA